MTRVPPMSRDALVFFVAALAAGILGWGALSGVAAWAALGLAGLLGLLGLVLLLRG